jgi:hypothetical protein
MNKPKLSDVTGFGGVLPPLEQEEEKKEPGHVFNVPPELQVNPHGMPQPFNDQDSEVLQG